MLRIRVKVCGITNYEDALLAVHHGADALGFIFAESPRRVDVPTAGKIVGQLPPFVAKVGVFKDRVLSEVIEIMNDVGLSHAQLHGSETVEYTKQLGRRAIKVFHVTGPAVLEEMRRFQLPTAMLDVPKGQSASILDFIEIAARAAEPGHLIISGELTPENVREAIIRIRPFAVDVARGVEEAPGKKSEAKLERFFQQVREAEYDLQSAR
ncbi:MAG: phosphoribosylanthranilate isomerase [Acidobacteria bacterium]|nr:phosphoribosylanthranilate isomerase [Acidobacteriota bacterium]